MFDRILPVLRDNQIMVSEVLIVMENSILIRKFIIAKMVDCG
ncbi:MAG: hypothetical protein ABUK20_06680 [Anaerolineales bacterium]